MSDQPVRNVARRERLLFLRRAASLLACVSLTCPLLAQSTRSSSELPEDVRAALERIEDFSFNFAQPGFYAVLEHVMMTSSPPGHTRPALEIHDWADLLERPADFRGLPLTIEGVVGRNKNWRLQQDEYRHLGPVWQLELRRADQPIAVTLILTNDAGDIPIGATIRATGYFVMMRQYYGEKNRLRQAALLVAHGPTLISRPAAHTHIRSTSRLILVGIVTSTTALLITWLLLRRSVGRRRQTTHELRASAAAPVSLADDLAKWAAEQSDQQPDDGDNHSDST